MPDTNRPTRRRTVTVVVLLWFAASLIQATIVAAQEQVFFPFALSGALIEYGILGLLAIPVWMICAWLLEHRQARWRTAVIHLALALAILAIWQGLHLGIFYLIVGSLRPLELERTGLWQLLGAITTYIILVSGIIGVQLARRYETQRQRETELILLAREAEIRALKAQIRPHFLFNTLNSIYSLIGSRPREAELMVDRLAELLRRTVETADDDLVPLDDELASVQAYLDIERIRFGERLTFSVDVDSDSRSVLVPPFLLQPFIENAIKHGIATSPGGGEIRLDVRRMKQNVEVCIRDNGDGAELRKPGSTGRGIEISRRRLENLFGPDFSLDCRSIEPKGFEVLLRIPCRLAEG